MDPRPTPAGWLDSLRSLGLSLLAILRGRFELLAVELREEKLRLVSVLVWLGIALTVGAAGLLVAIGALAIWLWVVAGFAGVLGLVLGCVAISAAILSKLRNQIRNGPPLFVETIKEFKKDAQCLKKN